MKTAQSLRYSTDVQALDIDYLWQGIVDFNNEIGPMRRHPPYEPFRLIVRTDTGDIVAGILSKTYLKSMYVDLLWIDESFRGQGIGTDLLAQAELHAKENNCRFIHLDTFSFQAIDFYLKQGYEVFAMLDDYPEDAKRYFLKKSLVKA